MAELGFSNARSTFTNARTPFSNARTPLQMQELPFQMAELGFQMPEFRFHSGWLIIYSLIFKLFEIYAAWMAQSALSCSPYSYSKGHPCSSGVTTGGNQSTRRKPVVFGRVKLEALFSHVTEVKL
jgi:hypothetical protein